MRIAIPMEDGHLAQHFGHCRTFALVDVDPVLNQITALAEVPAPDHQPGLLPPWLKERGVDLVIAGGMGSRAIGIFQDVSIAVVVGAPAECAEALAAMYLNGSLAAGSNACDH